MLVDIQREEECAEVARLADKATGRRLLEGKGTVYT
jgi:hypothetical protein